MVSSLSPHNLPSAFGHPYSFSILLMSTVAYKTVHDIAGPLLFVQGVEGVTYDELCEVELPSGDRRLGKVLESREGMAVVQLFDVSIFKSAIPCY